MEKRIRIKTGVKILVPLSIDEHAKIKQYSKNSGVMMYELIREILTTNKTIEELCK